MDGRARDARDERRGVKGGAWTYLVKHGVHDIAFGKESVGVEVRPEPYEDLLTHINV